MYFNITVLDFISLKPPSLLITHCVTTVNAHVTFTAAAHFTVLYLKTGTCYRVSVLIIGFFLQSIQLIKRYIC